MSLCVLNSKGDSCLPKKVIKDLKKKILPNNDDSNLPANIIIDKIATKLKCNSSDSRSAKESCRIEKIKSKINDSEAKNVMNKTLLTYFKLIFPNSL